MFGRLLLRLLLCYNERFCPLFTFICCFSDKTFHKIFRKLAAGVCLFSLFFFSLRFTHRASEALLRSASMLNVSIVMLPDKTWPAVGTQLHLGSGKCSTVLSLPQQKRTIANLMWKGCERAGFLKRCY